MNFTKNLFLLILTAFFLAQATYAQRVCEFNQPVYEIRKSGTYKRDVSQSKWVEDFGDVGEVIRDTSGRLYWGSCENEENQEGASLAEVLAVHCSGNLNGKISNEEIDSMEDFSLRSQDQLDSFTEEIVFRSAVKNIDELTSCQEGLFNHYNDPEKSEFKKELISKSYNKFLEIGAKVKQILMLRRPAEVRELKAVRFLSCTKEVCSSPSSFGAKEAADIHNIRAELAKYDAELAVLLATIPMGNREQIRKSLLDVYRSNKKPSLEDFSKLYNEQMQGLSKEVNTTREMIDGIKHKDNKGNTQYCIDSDLKKQLYRSGQIEAVVQGANLGEYQKNISCRMGRRYGVQGDVITELALVPTYFVGYGLGRLAIRAGIAGMSARGVAAMKMTSRLSLLGVQTADVAVSLNSAVDACSSDSFITGLQGNSCDPETEIFNAIREANLAECAANIAFYGMSNVAAIKAFQKTEKLDWDSLRFGPSFSNKPIESVSQVSQEMGDSFTVMFSDKSKAVDQFGNPNIFEQYKKMDSTTLKPGNSYVVLVRDGVLYIGDNYRNARGGTNFTHIQLARDFGFEEEYFFGMGGAIRVNRDGSIDIGGRHMMENDMESAELIEQVIHRVNPNIRTRTTAGRVLDMPEPNQ